MVDRDVAAAQVGSRGVDSTAEGSSSSTRSIAKLVSAIDFARTAVMPAPSAPASSMSAIMSRIACMPMIGGVPLSQPVMPGAGVYSGPISNGAAAPSHPWIGCRSSSW